MVGIPGPMSRGVGTHAQPTLCYTTLTYPPLDIPMSLEGTWDQAYAVTPYAQTHVSENITLSQHRWRAVIIPDNFK